MSSMSRHLRVIESAPDPRLAESEKDVLRRVLGALDEAIEHPSLSRDWVKALRSSYAYLEAFVEDRDVDDEAWRPHAS